MDTYTITLTNDQMLVIDRALGQMPYSQAAPVVAAINAQLAESAKPVDQPMFRTLRDDS